MSEATKRCPYCHEEILEAARKCKHCGEWLEDPPSTATTGTMSSNPETIVRDALGPQYDILKELGRGGMAIVYKAIQRNLGRDVALKVLPQGLTHDEKLLKRFHREARSAAQLNHPHIVTIFDEGEMNGVHYMAMEYLNGRDLHDIIQENGPRTAGQLVSLLAPIAEALGYAHRNETVHRDVKSSNVMVTDIGRPVLMDFGIAHASSESRLTQTGTVLGTPEYMSPEQARGNEIDYRSDLYSLGVVLYEGITTELPHTGGHPMSVVYKVLHESYTPPSQINPDCPDWLEQIIVRLLMKDPADRYQTGEEIAKALRSKDPGERVPVPSSGDGEAPPSGPASNGAAEPAQTQVFRPEDDGSSPPPSSEPGQTIAQDPSARPQSSGASVSSEVGTETATAQRQSSSQPASNGASQPQRQRLHIVALGRRAVS